MIAVSRCPACLNASVRPVFEFNGLVLLHSMRESPLSRYDYRLCESCGLVYASQRPDRTDLAFLYSHFDEFLGRDDRTMPEHTIRDRLADGWLSSEEAEHVNDDLVRKVFNKQISESAHVPVLAASVPLRGMRILELRATTGLISTCSESTSVRPRSSPCLRRTTIAR